MSYKFCLFLIIPFLFNMCNSSFVNKQQDHKYTNSLINESSPYLLQHAHNPVDWYPWGEKALEKAKQEDKLVIISIGYAACHWCHVMEEESFEDSLVAQLMNEKFVSIKVDREERPDVDDVYMTAAQLINQRGGWPLNAIALPDGRPVFAGTYYPKEDWMKILKQLSDLMENDRTRLEQYAENITKGIMSTAVIEVNKEDISFSLTELDAFMSKGLESMDYQFGGRLGAPKFPMPNSYEFLMKYHWMTGHEKAMEITETTLQNMAHGGIYDQLGGGFARYSVDQYWLVPHFEKMLYDNGQLVSIYAQAFQLTGNPLYKRIVEETCSFVERELMSPESGFYSSLDADSEGEEGKFYVWTKAEIDSLLNDDEAHLFCSYFDVTEEGNWEEVNILNMPLNHEAYAEENNMSSEELRTLIEDAKEKLFKARGQRVRPGLDDKILTSWNALMMRGYIDAYHAFNHPAYLTVALNNAEFIIQNQMDKSGRLNRNYKDGKSSINAFLDDYALVIDAFIHLYQATFNEAWLQTSGKLLDYAIAHFFNEETRMFNYTSDIDPPLVARKSEFSDNVIPSSNSVMARNLLTYGTLKYYTPYIEMSRQMLKNMHPQIVGNSYISFYSNWLQLYIDFAEAPYEIAIVGENAMELKTEMAGYYLGNSIFLGGKNEGTLALLKDKLLEGETYIYVCQNKTCKLPVKDVDKALELIN